MTVHVLVPAYSTSPYLAQAVTSVLDAGDGATSVTVLDDGSPDDEVRRVADRLPAGVEYVRLEHNRGVAGAFQACAELSRGKYTVIMGSDDLMESSYVTEVRRLAHSHGSPAMVLPGVTVIGASGEPVFPLADRVKAALAPRRERLLRGDRLAASLLLGNWLYFPAVAWRTDVLRRHGFRQDLQTALDFDLELRLIFNGEALAWSPRSAFRYRRHAHSFSSLSAVSGDRFREEHQVFRAAEDQAQALGWRRSAWAAKLHPTSRLHAALLRTSALASWDGDASARRD